MDFFSEEKSEEFFILNVVDILEKMKKNRKGINLYVYRDIYHSTLNNEYQLILNSKDW